MIKPVYAIILFLLIFNSGLTQLCVPTYQSFGLMQPLKNGKTILMDANVDGEFMIYGPDPKELEMNIVLLSAAGEIEKRDLLKVNWPYYYYNIMTCCYSDSCSDYSKKNRIEYYSKFYQYGQPCSEFKTFYSPKGLIVVHYLTADTNQFSYYFFDEDGALKAYQRCESNPADIVNLQSVLSKKNNEKITITEVPFQLNYKDENRVKAIYTQRTFEFIFQVDSSQNNLPNHTLLIKSDLWEISLPGRLFIYNSKPFVYFQGQNLYLMVHNTHIANCVFQVPDVYPSVYKIDLSTGKIIWKNDPCDSHIKILKND